MDEKDWCAPCRVSLTTARVSPDAFIQQALQLAWYRDQGYATATYETASTRMMLHGRTDVIRTLSVESRDFVKAMLNEKATVRVFRRHMLMKGCRAISKARPREHDSYRIDQASFCRSWMGSSLDGVESDASW